MPSNEGRVFISYIGELARTPPEGVLLVEQNADYVRACHTLSLRSHSELKVWVRSKSHFAWLRDFAEQIGCPAVFVEKTPRLLLAEQWNVELPDWLTDAEVINHHLLETDVDSRNPACFETRYLAHVLGTPFEKEELGAAGLVPVVNALVSENARVSFREDPLLGRCLVNKCEQWAARANESWLKEICERLPADPVQVWQWLSFWSALHGYPGELLEYVLAPAHVLLVRKIPPAAVAELPLESTARGQILDQIEPFFNGVGRQVSSSSEFQKLVGSTSGRLSREYQLVSDILKSGRFTPTTADVQAVRTKFQACPGVSQTQLDLLNFCVKPNRPSLLGPGDTWSLAEWVRWTTEEYVPYRTWQVHNGQYDADLEKTVARFSDWYIGEYASIHSNSDLSMTHCLTNIARGSQSDLTIILLVDCLPLFFAEILDDALRNVGLSRHGQSYRFAGLPTVTEYNKTALLSGEWQDKSGNYEALVKTRATANWSGKRVVYLGNLKALSDMPTPQEPTVVVLNFVDGDELLHSDVESKNTTYEDELQRIFGRLADTVSRLAQEWGGSKEHFGVYVVTDHGACQILEEEKRSFDSAVIMKLFANEKHRYAPVPDEQANKIPANLWDIGHRFKRPFSSDSTTFFLPTGHNTVHHAGAARGFMHGGATPEEVIVPTVLYKLVKAAWKTPAARFLNLDLDRQTGRAKFYIQRVVILEIEMQNPNSTDVHVLRATVMSPQAGLKSCDAETIPAASAKSLRMSCYFEKAALGQKPLEIEIAYEIGGEQHTLRLVLESEFKSAMAGGFSLRDL